jgi:WD40 repeat protein
MDTYCPNGKTLASAGRDHKVIVWDATTGESLATLSAHSQEANGVTFSPDGKMLASSDRDGHVKLWDVSKLASR